MGSLFPSCSPVFRSIVETVVPDASSLGERGWGEVERIVDGSLSRRPAQVQRQLRLFLVFVQWAPVLRRGHRFISLGAGDRARWLRRLERHPLGIVRVGFWGVRTLALLGYYGREDSVREIGYAADRRGWEAQPRVRAATP